MVSLCHSIKRSRGLTSSWGLAAMTLQSLTILFIGHLSEGLSFELLRWRFTIRFCCKTLLRDQSLWFGSAFGFYANTPSYNLWCFYVVHTLSLLWTRLLTGKCWTTRFNAACPWLLLRYATLEIFSLYMFAYFSFTVVFCVDHSVTTFANLLRLVDEPLLLTQFCWEESFFAIFCLLAFL